VRIDIDNRQRDVALDVEQLARLFRRCLEMLGLGRAELSVVLCGEREMARLNRERMGSDGPTDVLSFPQLELQPARLRSQVTEALRHLPEGEALAIGDVVLCPAVILAQAPPDPWSAAPASLHGGAEPGSEADQASQLVGVCPDPPGPESQLHLVAVHGMLHLLGHDHATLEQARAMATEQARLLEATFDLTLLSDEDPSAEDEAGDPAAAAEEDELGEDESEPAEDWDEVEVEEYGEDEDLDLEHGDAGDDELDRDDEEDGRDEEPLAARQRVRVAAGAVGAMETPEGFRSGFVALVGRPNVGKSTLMNTLVGTKVSITSPKPQTTRNRILGIYTDERAQVLFIDTPGLHQARDAFNRRLVAAAIESLAEADIVCYMIEPPAEVGPQEQFVLEQIREVQTPVYLLINKVDTVAKGSLLPLIERFSQLGSWEEIFPISALDGTNLSPLMDALVARLPEGPALFPSDQLTDRTERFIVQERIREQILRQTRQEVPYSTAVAVEQWEETPGLLKIAALIHVERQNQKGIVIGRGGSMLKAIGTAARKDLEAFFGCKVFLQLHVVVSENWRQRESFLREQHL
jgi:GTPase